MSSWQLWSTTMLLLLAAAWLLWRSARHASDRALRVARPRGLRRRLPHDSLMGWLLDYLLVAGIQATPRAVWVAGGTLLLALSGVLVMLELRLGGLLMLGGLVVINLLLRLRAQRLRRRVRDALPELMEHIMRDIGIGTTIELAFRRNAERVSGPLFDATARVNARRDLGMELHEGLRREAQLLRVQELDLLATAIEINQIHGGSLKAILASFVDLLRQQDKGRRELRALTGETRVTAFVLASVPVALAGFMWLTNPEFLAPMLESPAGQMALWLAVALEVGGCLALWRMLRSV
ncbi:hypothetical protein BWR19_07855 [Halomonas sp. 1513]|nr:type II secretion system F family protein [Halomonas sp. 1513]APX92850.1 hypothetical protein BWR19_07855 [Halomonas sp. 1513]